MARACKINTTPRKTIQDLQPLLEKARSLT